MPGKNVGLSEGEGRERGGLEPAKEAGPWEGWGALPSPPLMLSGLRLAARPRTAGLLGPWGSSSVWDAKLAVVGLCL